MADHQWQTVQQEEQQNEELLHISNPILELTKAIHAMNTGQSDGLATHESVRIQRHHGYPGRDLALTGSDRPEV
jgi:hypothetical protein